MAEEPDAEADGPGGDQDVKQRGAHGAPFEGLAREGGMGGGGLGRGEGLSERQ
jgi:hypothetical protein